ncbi:spore cortex-lytic enzyme [Alkalihalobacterium alkalicellulosilyticum]|uniref:spore cortex-lytic enzyme n=1 Tax=Alkalihalobacterium alkalicellulosilyticum TaxID=1912214 RepID=UPI003AF12B3E
MRSLSNKMKYPLMMVIALLMIMGTAGNPIHAFSDQIIQRGATGDDVVELQARLQYNGFYNGTIDGVYGWSTYWAVRNFQEQFGMEVDGLVGPKMKDMLERATNFDKEFVHNALKEGRKFTHYGSTPLHIQQGEPGSRDKKDQPKKQQQQPDQQQGQGQQQPDQQQGQGQQQQQPDQQQGQGQQQQQPDQQQGQGQQQQQPDQQQGQGQAQQQPAQQQGQAQQQPAPAEETPEGEPVPYEEQPEAQDNGANIQKAMNVPSGFSENDLQLMAQAVYGEARGEPYVGQVAVAAVILNRINSPIFPNTVSEVIFEPRAFTAVADGQINLGADDSARRAVLDALNGQDPSGGAIYYFNPDTATSGWIWTRPQIKRIGKHIFCN